MSLKYALGFVVVGMITLACGGGVSLGDANQGLSNGSSGTSGTSGTSGGSGSGTGAKKDCSAANACGPQLGMPSIQCDDGSIGGSTGKCLPTADGNCGWEVRECPKDGGTAPALNWYMTCGDPVCQDPGPDAGAPVKCDPLGSACKTKGETCGNPALNCGAVQVCDDHDPKGGVGGCPISTKKAKQDISYVNDADLTRLHDETIRMKLATYRYKGKFVDPSDPNATHLGFIVEDQPQSLSVDRGHDRVDLYGYMSMAVATMQVQEKQLQTQEKQIAALQKQIDALKASRK
jgi:hypothetical protein